MRKRIILAAFAAFMGIAAMAQQIAVVSESGATSVYQTLTEAIEEADPGSVIYLPGGGFQIHDSVKITKRLSIIGIGHKAKNENVDGNTTIAGNLFFNEGSSGSSVMGCYISGNVNIGNGGVPVNNVLIKYCNINAVAVNNNTCTGTIVNQNYIRNGSNFKSASVTFSNNIAHSVFELDNGIITNNIFTNYYYYSSNGYGYSGVMLWSDNCTISNNILLATNGANIGSNCLVTGNMRRNDNWGDDPINVSAEWTEVFTNYNGGKITPASDFHFKPEYQQYSDCGIYGGTGFNDGALPPVPFIVSKSIPEQTDAAGNLNIKIRVKAGE